MSWSRSCQCGFLLIAGLALTPRSAWAQAQDRPPLPDYLSASIPEAIERGKKYLLRTQQTSGPRAGSWAADDANKVGYAALPALTLLECGVPASDPHIQLAAHFVRVNIPTKELISTYEVSLALLFLDRLGNPKDKPYIEILAGRLVASQTITGGWGYRVQYLQPKETEEILGLMKKLEKAEPLPLQHLLAGGIPNMNNPFVKAAGVSEKDLSPKRVVKVRRELVPLPCFAPFGALSSTLGSGAKLVDPEGPGAYAFVDKTDNSTTQFALMALWAARRHDIPCTRTGSMAFMRFHTSQNADGTWGYPYVFGGTGGTNTMINTGLLGMAVGHGIVKEMKLDDTPPVDEDARILRGFGALIPHIGEPQDKIKDLKLPNLYFLWGLERVCVLYNIHLVGNRDWYRWGAETLVANQDPEQGHWEKGEYPGSAPVVDTSFALMFLKRANLAKDLASYLAFSPKKLNDGVVKLSAPPPPPPPKPEPPKVAEKKPEPPKAEEKKAEPVRVAEAKPAPPTTSPTPPSQPQVSQPAPTPPAGGGTWWIWLLVGLGAVMILGGVLFFIFTSGSSEEEEPEEDDRPRKKKKKTRRD